MCITKYQKLIETRPKKSTAEHFTYLYALRDSGEVNMMHAYLALAKNYFGIETQDDSGNWSADTKEALENREEIVTAVCIMAHWLVECQCGHAKEADPTFDRSVYNEQLEIIPTTGY